MCSLALVPLTGFTGIIMRPNKQASDIEYYLNQISYWKNKAEEYFLMSAKVDSESEDWFIERRDHCTEKANQANLKWQEACGLIDVYTGRAKPFKAAQVSLSFKATNGKIPAFNI